MTDLEKLQSVLTEVGIDYEMNPARKVLGMHEGFDALFIGEGIGKCDGYHDFFAAFNFDKTSGRLVNYGVWE